MPTPSEIPSTSEAATLLRLGQAQEEQGRLEEAVTNYHRAIHAARVHSAKIDVETRRTVGLIWMNLGNALQKLAIAARYPDAIRAYDEAIAIFQSLPFERVPEYRNHLGAAWLNRGHAQVSASDPAAVVSFERAIDELTQLPLDRDPSFRLNLAGAWTNLAHALLSPPDLAVRERSRMAAKSALAILAPMERERELFATMGLRARRALIMALGDLLHAAEQARQPVNDLASEATDAADEGLSIAREFESRGQTQLRPLATRLFRLGTQLYGVHQPHFLSEFVLENVRAPGFRTDAEFRTIARDALAHTLDALQRPQLLVANLPEGEKLIAIARSLRDAQKEISALPFSA